MPIHIWFGLCTELCKELYKKPLRFPINIWFGLCTELCKEFYKKTLIILKPGLPFKEIIHAFLLKKSITHNKNESPIMYLLFNCISARSTP